MTPMSMRRLGSIGCGLACLLGASAASAQAAPDADTAAEADAGADLGVEADAMPFAEWIRYDDGVAAHGVSSSGGCAVAAGAEAGAGGAGAAASVAALLGGVAWLARRRRPAC